MPGTAPRRRLGPLPLGLTLALAVALTACGATSSTSSAPRTTGNSPSSATSSADAADFEPGPADFRQIRRLLADQVVAVRKDDEQAFLATIDPQQPALVAQQKVLFGNLSRLDISRLSYDIDPTSLVEPADVPGGDPVLRPTVVEHLQITGTMRKPVSNQVNETFVRRDGHWLVGNETQATENDHFDSPQERPWFGVPITARKVGPLTVLVDTSQSDSIDGLTTAIRQDLQYDARLLGVPASYRLLVDATTNGLSFQFSALDKEEAAAVTFGLSSSDKLGSRTTGLAGMAIKVNPTIVDQVVNDNAIVRHELTHFLLRRYNGAVPKWLSEGIATWVEYYPDDFGSERIPADLYARLQAEDHVQPSIGHVNEDPDANYLIAQATATWLVSHGGVARLIALMKAYRTDYAGVNVDALTGRLLREVYGVSQRQAADGAWGLLAEFQH
jgi:hypothetical protein